jgi:hypothetical protein
MKASNHDPSFAPQPAANLTPKLYMALADTGASCTCLTSKVIQDLGLAPIGRQQVGGVHGSGSTNAYQFQVGFLFPQGQAQPTGLVSTNIMIFQVNGVEFTSPGSFDVLLGRDILCTGSFSMSFDGHAILSL